MATDIDHCRQLMCFAESPLVFPNIIELRFRLATADDSTLVHIEVDHYVCLMTSAELASDFVSVVVMRTNTTTLVSTSDETDVDHSGLLVFTTEANSFFFDKVKAWASRATIVFASLQRYVDHVFFLVRGAEDSSALTFGVIVRSAKTTVDSTSLAEHIIHAFFPVGSTIDRSLPFETKGWLVETSDECASLRRDVHHVWRLAD